MKADLSRSTFDRTQHYSSVRLQQGRIVTDADWNEQADIARYRDERQARDTVGPCAAPLEAAGYGLVAETHAFAVRALDANRAWVIGEDGALLATANGGTDWTLVDVGTAVHLRAVAAAGNTAWLVGDSGVVRKSDDGGATWAAQDAGTRDTLRGVFALDANRCWAVADAGLVLSTADGGVQWRTVQAPAARLYAVGFADALNGIAVGQDGTIVQTLDGGETWNEVASETSAHLRALARVGTTAVWVAGESGTILRSEDGGATWLTATTPSSGTLHAIAFRDAMEGWAVGAGGIVLHSVDGGATWQVEEEVTSGFTLRGVSVTGAEAAWAVGDHGIVLRLGAGSPAIAETTLPPVNLSIEPGRCYVQGVLCELEARSSYGQQPDGGAGTRLSPGAYLLYLDAWQRHVSALQAPAIREVALPADTATRARTVAQVRALPLPASSPSLWHCDSAVEAWDELVAAPRARLSARAEPQLATASLCEIAATAGYRRLENQLYRVEVHAGGSHPAFKWSRENGSVEYAVVSVTPDAVTGQTVVRVAARGRDLNLDLAAHDRIELIDDDAELTGRAGMFFEYLADGDDELELVLAGVPTGALGQVPARHPILRRWDQKPTTAGEHVLPIVEDSWIELEEGVQVRFAPGGSYRPGDYWLIPARTRTGDIEWPRDEHGEPAARPPAGIVDAYCRLGIVEVDDSGTVSVRSDCRELFPPLTDLEQLLYVSGDGQDAPPGTELPQALAVRVARGQHPIVGATVRFQVESGSGTLAGGSLLDVTTDASGMASCRWSLDPDPRAEARHQSVRAVLLDAGGEPVAMQTVLFCATATVTLQYVSGDGQVGLPGQNLAQPLEARVANGQTALAQARVRFTASGGGQLVGSNPVVTGADGMARMIWRLGTGGVQRVRAELLDLAGNAVQDLHFNASFRSERASGGCEVTIGKEGDEPELTDEVLKRLLERFGRRLCLCFLPGEHEVGALAISVERVHLTMHGCGEASRVVLRGPLEFRGFESVDVSRLAIGATPNSGFVFEKCDHVRVTDIHALIAGSNERPFLAFAGNRSVAVEGCRLRGKEAELCAVFADAAATVTIARNEIDGILSFYGAPGSMQIDLPMERLLERMRKSEDALRTAPGRLFLTGNTIGLLTIGRGKSAEIARFAVGDLAVLDGLFQVATLGHNVFLNPHNVVASRLQTFHACTFVSEPPRIDPLGLLIAQRLTATGNVAVELGDHSRLFAAVDSNGFSEAGNQLFILH